MNDLIATTLTDNITTSITTNDMSDCIKSIADTCSSLYCNPFVDPYNPYNYTITTSAYPTKLETNSNELKINIKKFQIKFNFNL